MFKKNREKITFELKHYVDKKIEALRQSITAKEITQLKTEVESLRKLVGRRVEDSHSFFSVFTWGPETTPKPKDPSERTLQEQIDDLRKAVGLEYIVTDIVELGKPKKVKTKAAKKTTVKKPVKAKKA